MISSYAKVTPMPTKSNKYLHRKGVINFQIEVGVLMK